MDVNEVRRIFLNTLASLSQEQNLGWRVRVKELKEDQSMEPLDWLHELQMFKNEKQAKFYNSLVEQYMDLLDLGYNDGEGRWLEARLNREMPGFQEKHLGKKINLLLEHLKNLRSAKTEYREYVMREEKDWML